MTTQDHLHTTYNYEQWTYLLSAKIRHSAISAGMHCGHSYEKQTVQRW